MGTTWNQKVFWRLSGAPRSPQRELWLYCFLTQERGFENSKMMEDVKIVKSNSERAMLKPMIGKREG